ncbi:hypothetical protein DPM19_07415 [Actinomadura craniellae]|uniref:DUF4258 domain-containing protein n=1 Tax=Actinomadura craniellae TaxID=2231787 RepID=A0A365H905_9ACTN|nr:hypothetical protein [Actinomadura craniellae]RAY15614.1 hypothetical protein DPM19_07415 [Actinomadura craniellae]
MIKPLIELPLEWDDANRDHAQRHGVTEEEINQAIGNPHEIAPARRNDGTELEARYLVHGTTDAGRRITVVIKYPVTLRREWGELELDLARPITAYERK